MDLQTICAFTDYFILCSASSNRMLDALAETVVKTAKQTDGLRPMIEGRAEDGWLVIDLGDIVVHLLSPDQRDYYGIEELWSAGKVVLRIK